MIDEEEYYLGASIDNLVDKDDEFKKNDPFNKNWDFIKNLNNLEFVYSTVPFINQSILVLMGGIFVHF